MSRLSAVLVVSVLPVVSSCGLLSGGDSGDDGGDDGADAGEGEGAGEGTNDGNSEGSTDGDGQGQPGWTVMSISDFEHQEDDITALYFSSTGTGFVGTKGSPGVLLKASAGAFGDFAFPAETLTDPVGALGDFSVRGIVPTSLGLAIRLDTSGALVTSDDDFGSFELVASGLNYGISPLEGLHETPSGDWVALIGNFGQVATATQAPSAATTWTETWAPPPGIPTTPLDFPVDGCAYGPATRITENLTQIGAFNGDTVMYITESADRDSDQTSQVVCVSTDAGVSFAPAALGGTENSSAKGPTAIVMASATTAFAAVSDFLSAPTGGTAMIHKTTNSGTSWAPTTMPAVVTGNHVQINALFFAPGGTVGYAVGQIGVDAPLLLKTTDGGDTWVEAAGSAALAAALDSAPNFPNGRLYTGFALDAENLWVGGDNGTVLYSNSGGQ